MLSEYTNLLMKHLFLTIGLLSILSLAQAQQINTEESAVNFHIRSADGSFTGMTGEFSFDAENLDLCSFNICIDAATINTGNEKRDNHLRTEDFFEVETYPEICFTSTEVVKTKDGYSTSGLLKMHGVEKEIQIPFTMEENTFRGDFELKRKDYGVGGKSTILVANGVEVSIVCVLE